jgi:hypothetical protein
MGAFTHVHCVSLDCPAGDDEYCYIPLPRQSPLGIYEGQHYQPTGEWPVTFLCRRHGTVSVDLPDSVHLTAEPMVPGLPVPPLWRIDCECAHENCGRMNTIYTARAPDREALLKGIARKNPTVPCGDHNLVWREDLIQLTDFAF